MQLGTVVGQATATVKHQSMMGWKLLVIQLTGAQGQPDGDPILAIDYLGAGLGTPVIVSNDGAGTRALVGHKNSPIRWHVMGIQD